MSKGFFLHISLWPVCVFVFAFEVYLVCILLCCCVPVYVLNNGGAHSTCAERMAPLAVAMPRWVIKTKQDVKIATNSRADKVKSSFNATQQDWTQQVERCISVKRQERRDRDPREKTAKWKMAQATERELRRLNSRFKSGRTREGDWWMYDDVCWDEVAQHLYRRSEEKGCRHGQQIQKAVTEIWNFCEYSFVNLH